MRAAPLLLLTLLAAGCLSTPAVLAPATPAKAVDAAGGFRCDAGLALVGVGADGRLVCGPSFAGLLCPEGEFLRGVTASGEAICAAPNPTASPIPPSPSPAPEASPSLQVDDIYGWRNDTRSDIWDMRLRVELEAGAAPVDVAKLLLRYDDGTIAGDHTFSADGIYDRSGPSWFFDASWIRGAPAGTTMEPGDFIELHFNNVMLPPGTSARLALVPDSGDVVHADFTTPQAYGDGMAITLR